MLIFNIFFLIFKNHQIPDLISSITSLTFSLSPPHPFAATHSTSLKIFNPQTLSPSSTISSFSDVVSSASFRCDGLLIAASDLSGLIQVFDVKTRTPLRKLRSYTRPVRFLKYPLHDKLYLVSGGDDAVVKYWDVASETPLLELLVIFHLSVMKCVSLGLMIIRLSFGM